MVKTIIFDIGNVLIAWDPRLLYRKLLASEQEVDDFLAHVCSPAWNQQMDAGKPFAEAVDELSRQYPQKAGLIHAYHERWIETVSGPIDGTVKLLERLDARGLPLLALSNWSAETFPLVRHAEPYRFLDRFATIYLSGELGMVKPHEPIFLHLMQHAGVRAEDCLFIDDSAANIATAQRLGFVTHHFTDPSALEQDLVARNLLD